MKYWKHVGPSFMPKYWKIYATSVYLVRVGPTGTCDMRVELSRTHPWPLNINSVRHPKNF